jgi:5-(carboxyamino)imidazole ribonucleotide synthase
MLAIAGSALGVRFRVMDSVADACAGQVAALTHADYNDRDALAGFARGIDVATFDFENVPASAAEQLASLVPVFPNPRALALAQDRLEEKRLFRGLGMGTPEFRAVDSYEELERAAAEVGLPAVLKTRRLGYDGKGQFRILGPDALETAWRALGGVPLILEAFVPFQREVSQVSVRARDGSIADYPLTQNWHADGVLSASLAPAPGGDALAAQAQAFARRLLTELDYVGVLAIEFFVRDGELLANEIAPRVHNSGHWTIEGAEVSQFENHVRAVLGWPLGSTRMRGHAAMLNFIGSLPDRAAVLAETRGHWHDYGKAARPGRKVGHATLRADDPGELADELGRVARALGRESQVEPLLQALRG